MIWPRRRPRDTRLLPILALSPGSLTLLRCQAAIQSITPYQMRSISSGLFPSPRHGLQLFWLLAQSRGLSGVASPAVSRRSECRSAAVLQATVHPALTVSYGRAGLQPNDEI